MDFDGNNHLVSLFDSINDAIITFDNELRYTYINKRACEIINKIKEDVLGKKVTDIFPGILHTKLGKPLQIVLKTGKPYTWEYYSSGGKQWLRGNAYKTSQGIVIFYTDITNRHKLEEDLIEKAKLIELSHEAIFIMDKNNKIVFWNKGSEDLYGWKSNEVIGKHGDTILKTVYPISLEKIHKEIEKKKTWEGTIKHITKKGKELIIQSRWSLLHVGDTTKILEINRDITEHESVKRDLLMNEKKFRSLIENSSDGILVSNGNLKFTYVSSSIKKILGYSQDEFLKMSLQKIIHPDDFPLIMNIRKMLFTKEKNIKGEFRVKNKKGEWRWIEANSSNFLADAAVKGIVSNFRDITDKKLYELELEGKNRKITEIVENFNYGYYAMDKEWRYVYVNKKGEEMGHIKRDDVLGKTVWNVFPDVEKLEIGKAMRQVMKNRTPMTVTQYYPSHNMWYENYIYPSIEGIAVYNRNSTEEKNIQQQVIDTQQELEAILKNIPNGVIVQDSESTLVYANKEAMHLLGYESIEQMMKSPRFEYIYKFDLQDEYGKKFPLENMPGRKAFETGKTVQVTIKFVNKKTNKSRWLTITSTVIYKGHGKNPLVINVLQDITEFKDIDVRKNNFISMASHELKTPLTSLKIYMHLLSDIKKLDTRKQTEYVTKAAEQIDKLQQLVSDLLDQSTIQQGKLSLQLKEIYFDFFIKEFIDQYQELLPDFHLIVKGKTDSIVTIDRYRMEQVLANLLSNAAKYSQDKKEIILTLSKKGAYVHLSVKDSGIGIPEKDLHNIFKPYYRVLGKRESTYPGLGMGLYITRDIVTKHGGDISVESTLGKGSVFTLSLPSA